MFQNTRQQYPTFPGLSNLSSQVPGMGQPSVGVASSSAPSSLFHSHHSTFNSSLGHSDTGLSIYDSCSGLQDVPGTGSNATYGQSLAQSMTLSTATHEALMQSGNAAYMQLYTKCLSWEAKHDAIKSLYDTVRSQILQPPNPYSGQPPNPYPIQHPMKPPVAPLPFRGGLAAAMAFVNQKLNQRQYPDVNYWFKEDWKGTNSDENDAVVMNEMEGTKGPGRVSQGINVTARFVEDANGTILNGWRVTDMRNLAQQIFHQLLQSNVAPETWRQATREALMYYLSEMYTTFPELRLCDGDWKARRLASRQYSGWYHSNVVKRGIKKEDAGSIDPRNSKSKSKLSKKRPALTVSTQPTKKSRPLPTPVCPATPVRSPTPDMEYMDIADVPGSAFDAVDDLPTGANVPKPPQPLESVKEPIEKPVDLPTPVSEPTPTPTPTHEELPEMLQVKAVSDVIASSAVPAPAPEVQSSGSALDILADVAAENAGIDGEQLAIENPLHDVFGAPTDDAVVSRLAAIADTDANDARTAAKGKKNEKDTAVYPSKTNHSARNAYLTEFYADFKKKNPSEKLMKSVFDEAFKKLTKEDLARYKAMGDDRKKAAKDAKSSALGAS